MKRVKHKRVQRKLYSKQTTAYNSVNVAVCLKSLRLRHRPLYKLPRTLRHVCHYAPSHAV